MCGNLRQSKTSEYYTDLYSMEESRAAVGARSSPNAWRIGRGHPPRVSELPETLEWSQQSGPSRPFATSCFGVVKGGTPWISVILKSHEKPTSIQTSRATSCNIVQHRATLQARYDPFNTMYIPLSKALDFIDVAQLQSFPFFSYLLIARHGAVRRHIIRMAKETVEELMPKAESFQVIAILGKILGIKKNLR